ncbi:MAG: hypothetical protein QOK37_1896 [Thermoanaerobaculia bacterium]|jgi:hypothetical protein|nr:hypothetical protein [Thermoanaerobaculia bacterium]
MVQSCATYDSERELVDEFTRALSDDIGLWGSVAFAQEFYYVRGRTDVVALTADGAVLAFEAKLLNWKGALHQAYRNTCFAHESYVVLPCNVARRAISSDAEFTRRGVGLCTLEGGLLKIIHPARKTRPLQNWLSQRATAHISGEKARDC